MSRNQYYDMSQILQMNAHYNIIFGERSNGKTYALLKYILVQHQIYNKKAAWLRRFQEDYTGKRGASLFEPLIKDDVISEITDGKWDSIYYFSSRWYLCRYIENDKGEKIRETEKEPFMYGFALSQMEHDKGNGYPDVTTIVFDEFITRGAYLRDEFVLFMNCLSTIIRARNDVKIFMLGNTVNLYCPYFNEMGLKHIKEMRQGTIDVYQLKHASGKTLKVAVEYCEPMKHGKKSDFYFAFDNQKLEMITNGIWELEIYPHCPYRYKPKNVLFKYFIEFDEDLLECEVVYVDNLSFTYIHRKTTPLKYPDKELIYTTHYDARPNWRRKLTNPRLPIEAQIYEFYATDKVFFQDNEVGEIVRNYLIWCGKKDV